MDDHSTEPVAISRETLDRIARMADAVSPAAGGTVRTIEKVAGIPLLNVIAATGIMLAVWAAKYGVPAHLAQIHDGYKQINDANLADQKINREQLEKLEQKREKDSDEQRAAFERDRDKLEKLFREFFGKQKADTHEIPGHGVT